MGDVFSLRFSVFRKKQAARVRRAGFTLVEVMLVVLMLSVLAAVAIPMMNPGVQAQLDAAAHLVAQNMAYGRGLAVATNDSYTYTFDLANNRFYLQYAGSNPALATLPPGPFYSAQDTAQRQYTNLSNVQTLGGSVTLVAVGTGGSGAAPVSTVQFGPYGQTSQAAETDIWLSAGAGTAQRYAMVRVNAVTGLATVETFQTTPPPSAIMSGS